ncbi:MAG: hypothetical protein ABSG41_12970 [Bryobacteraceae bacterium]|jgi:hypothetical protein
MNSALQKQITVMFSPLNNLSAADAFPAIGALSELLTKNCAPFTQQAVAAKPNDLKAFATASVEVWLRAVHSFLVSASLTEASPIWSSVAGYYSSHYSIRAFAHLFGLFHLYKQRRLIQLAPQGKGWVFQIDKKNGGDREHKLYWKYLHQHAELANDPFFYFNRDDVPESDGSHRNRANYADHIDRFPIFRTLDSEYLARRIQKIAEIDLSDVPIPNADRFPDIESVQIIAYHRIVKFRQLLDEAVGPTHRFWKVQRTPSWTPRTLTFEVIDPAYTSIFARKT